VVIGLDFDDPAADTVDEQRRSDQFRRDIVNAPVEEAAAKQSFRHG
jgi:hypothetical protein